MVLLLGVHQPVAQVLYKVVVGLNLELPPLPLLQPILLAGLESIGVTLDSAASPTVLGNGALVSQHLGLVPLSLLPFASLVDLLPQLVNLRDQLDILPHDIAVLIFMDLLLLLESLLQGSLGSLQVATLVILLLFNISINFDILRI